VDGRCDLNLDADILILKLRVHQRADDGCCRAGLVGTGGNGDLRADLQVRLLPVRGADAWVLQSFCGGVGQQRVRGGLADRHREIVRVQMRQVVERRGRGCACGCCCSCWTPKNISAS